MNSINIAIDQAKEIGRYAATSDKELSNGKPVAPGSQAHHPGDDTGRLALDAYRNHGADGMKSVVTAYHDGYNARAAELGTTSVTWDQIKNGIAWALPGATDEEQTWIPAAM